MSGMGVLRSPLAAYLLILITLIVDICAREYVPVLIWESGNVSKKETHFPVLLKLTTDDFADYILSKATPHSKEKPLVVAFAEENLSVEDFSWQDNFERGSFPNLQGLTSKSISVNFLPSVSSPLKSFKQLAHNGFAYKSVNVANEPIDAIISSAESGSVLVVKLDGPKPDEDRPEYLRRHDQMISDVFNKLHAKHANILAAYTGHYSSFFDIDVEPVHRVRRLMADATTDKNNDTKLWRDSNNKIFMYWSGKFPELTNKSASNSTVELSEPFDTTVDERESLQRLITKFKTSSGSITLRFRFPSMTSGYWSFSEVEYFDPNSNQLLILATKTKIQAPFNFSYHCGDTIVFKNESLELTFSKMQVQPFLQAARFSDAYDCVWFFTPAIWSGIFVTSILAFILIWGISMIMDIKTMDRFDDPKGKTITISATD